MAVTIYDIAREAKVGIGTVSRVFNGNPNVNPTTKDRVLTISKQLNYHPHAFAQALARRRTNTIAAIIPFFTNYFFVEILQGIQDKITNLGYDLILYGVTHAREVEEYLKKSLQRGRVDGILFFSTEFPYHFIERYSGESKPFVLVDTFHDKFDSIYVENFQGAVTATKHLISLGHSHIGMIDANLNNAPARERLRGFTEAMQSSGLEIEQKNVLISKFQKYDGYSREAGYLAMKELIEQSKNLPTALFIASDVQAIGALSALQEHGLRVPDDIAIVGFDDIELAAHFELTTMRQPMYRMGELAVEKLFQRLENPDAPPSHIHFVPSLIIRGSCGMNKNYSHIHEFSKTAE
jgi:LacI family transcriptional regulator